MKHVYPLTPFSKLILMILVTAIVGLTIGGECGMRLMR